VSFSYEFFDRSSEVNQIELVACPFPLPISANMRILPLESATSSLCLSPLHCPLFQIRNCRLLTVAWRWPYEEWRCIAARSFEAGRTRAPPGSRCLSRHVSLLRRSRKFCESFGCRARLLARLGAPPPQKMGLATPPMPSRGDSLLLDSRRVTSLTRPGQD